MMEVSDLIRHAKQRFPKGDGHGTRRSYFIHIIYTAHEISNDGIE